MSNVFAETHPKAHAEVNPDNPAHEPSGVFRTLAEEHERLATLLQKCSTAPTAAKRAELWHEVRQQLVAHEQAELEVVYAEFEMYASLSDILGQHEDASAHLHKLIEKVDSTPTDTLQWDAAVKQLHAALKWHAAREDEEFFPRAQSLIPPRRSEELNELFVGCEKTVESELDGEA